MARELIATVGVPGSGKSYWAQQQQLADPAGTVIVERDAIRERLFGKAYLSKKPEQKKEGLVTHIQEEEIRKGLAADKRVIVANTHLRSSDVRSLMRKAQDYGAKFEVEHFDTDPKLCRERNVARGAKGGHVVPEEAMDAMIERGYQDGHLKEMILGPANGTVFFLPRTTPGMKIMAERNQRLAARYPVTPNGVVVVDCDGTLALNHADAEWFLNRPGYAKNFKAFYEGLAKAKANQAVVETANAMRDNEDLNLVVLTGRDDSYAKVLMDFVDRSGLKASQVICKRQGDGRVDSDFKHDVLKGLSKHGLAWTGSKGMDPSPRAVVHAFDDRDTSIRTMEEAGVLVSRVLPPVLDHDASGRPIAPEAAELITIYGSGYCIRCGKPLKTGNIGETCKKKLYGG